MPELLGLALEAGSTPTQTEMQASADDAILAYTSSPASIPLKPPT